MHRTGGLRVAKTVGTDEWVEVVPASHGKTHVYLTADGGDVYLSNEEEPKEAVPYGVLMRDGDQIGASINDEASILNRNTPIYARAVGASVTVRAIYDSRVEPTSRRVTEAPGDAAQRLGAVDYIEETVSPASGVSAGFQLSPSGLSEFVESDGPFYLESVVAIPDQVPYVSGTATSDDIAALAISTYDVEVYNGDTVGGDIRQLVGARLSNPINFDPAIKFEYGDDIRVTVRNATSGSFDADVRVNFRKQAGEV